MLVNYILKRIFQIVPSVFGVITLIFFSIHLIPGDPIDIILGENALQIDKLELRARLNLDKPLIERIKLLQKTYLNKKLNINWVVKQENLYKFLKKISKKYKKLIIRPSNSKYFSGKFILNLEKKDNYKCECLNCGCIINSDKHCRDIKCPKCGNSMRRTSRPGIGKTENMEKVHGRTSRNQGHYHRYFVEHEHGMGKTEQRIGSGPLHIHNIRGWTVQPSYGHVHTLIPDKQKADDLGQLDTPSGDDMPRPIAQEEEKKYRYKCTKCDYIFESNKNNLKKCPLCKGPIKKV